MAKILVIDDERSIRNTLKEILELENHAVDVAEDGEEGLLRFEKRDYEVIMCDIKMAGMDGMEVLDKIVETGKPTEVIMISGHGTIETAVEALKRGAFDFIQKPLDLNRILITIKNATEKGELVEETKQLKKKITRSKHGTNIVGESAPILAIKEMINKVAPTDARVLITGGNGSGKELVAQQIHEKSQRSKAPFVEVNCAAIPSELIESELFGHEKGAFTSANKLRKGKFEQAHGGTLFLDEIGDMSLSAQAKVLRALQESKISRVGGDKEIKVDVRILAATNKDLKSEIEKETFREDLFHRLSVIPIQVPSLNDRKDDIPLLADYFLNKVCGEHGIPLKTISDKAIATLQEVNWTGNIREFRNIIERLIILGGQEISVSDVKLSVNI